MFFFKFLVIFLSNFFVFSGHIGSVEEYKGLIKTCNQEGLQELYVLLPYLKEGSFNNLSEELQMLKKTSSFRGLISKLKKLKNKYLEDAALSLVIDYEIFKLLYLKNNIHEMLSLIKGEVGFANVYLAINKHKLMFVSQVNKMSNHLYSDAEIEKMLVGLKNIVSQEEVNIFFEKNNLIKKKKELNKILRDNNVFFATNVTNLINCVNDSLVQNEAKVMLVDCFLLQNDDDLKEDAKLLFNTIDVRNLNNRFLSLYEREKKQIGG